MVKEPQAWINSFLQGFYLKPTLSQKSQKLTLTSAGTISNQKTSARIQLYTKHHANTNGSQEAGTGTPSQQQQCLSRVKKENHKEEGSANTKIHKSKCLGHRLGVWRSHRDWQGKSPRFTWAYPCKGMSWPHLPLRNVCLRLRYVPGSKAPS